MRRVLLSLILVVSGAIAAAPGPNPGTGGVLAPPAGPERTLTGVLGDRAFLINCRCYPWVIDKNGRSFELNVAQVVPQLQSMRGTRVRATGNWSTYIRDGRRIPYMIVTRLDPG